MKLYCFVFYRGDKGGEISLHVNRNHRLLVVDAFQEKQATVVQRGNPTVALQVTAGGNGGQGVTTPVLSTCYNHFIPIVGVGKRGANYLVHGDLLRQHSFGTASRFTGLVPADFRQ